LKTVTLYCSHDVGVEAHQGPAVAAETDTAPEKVPGAVGYPSAEAHLSSWETTIASLVTGKDAAKNTKDTKDAAEDTSPRTPGCAVLSRDQRQGYTVPAGEADIASDPFHRNSGGASKERYVDTDAAVQSRFAYSSRDTAKT